MSEGKMQARLIRFLADLHTHCSFLKMSHTNYTPLDGLEHRTRGAGEDRGRTPAVDSCGPAQQDGVWEVGWDCVLVMPKRQTQSRRVGSNAAGFVLHLSEPIVQKTGA